MSLRSILACSLLVLPMVAATPSTALAQATSRTFTEPVEYGTVERHDPFDYQQATDLMRERDVNVGVVDFAQRDDRVSFRAAGNANGDWYISPVWMTFPHTVDPSATADQPPDGDGGALPDQYDAVGTPIDADQYTHLSMRIHVEGDPGNLALDWFACQEWLSPCMGRMGLGQLEQGWNTVTMPIRANTSAARPRAWEGQIYGLRLTGRVAQPATLTLDWLRLYRGGQEAHEVEVEAQANRITYSNQPDPRRPQGVAANEVWGTLRPTYVNSQSMRVDVGGLPPGTWYLHDGDRLVGEVTVDPRPRPEILDPDRAGGADYATEVLGNPWDFEDRRDVLALRNVGDVRWGNGELSARAVPTSAAPRGNDPYLVMPLGPGGLDPVYYHRVTVDQQYDAAFNLDDGENPERNPQPGGSHGRLVWRTGRHTAPPSDCRHWSDGREFVFYKTWDRYTYDMKDVPPAQGMRSSAEPNLGVPGCAGPDAHWTDNGPITSLRFDPHEAPDDYRFAIRDLRIAADDAADPTFQITWRDPAAIPGTEVTIRLGDEVLATVPQEAGVNRFTFDATDRLPGKHRVSITARTPDGRVGRDVATGPLQVSPRIKGSDRVGTAVEVSRQSFDTARTAIVASARSFPDALVAVQLADAVQGPVLLTEPDRLDDRVDAELRRLGVREVIVAGGTSAVGGGVASALGAGGRTVTRIGGQTRYDTAARLAREAMARRGSDTAARVLVTTGDNFPDALAAGPWVGYADLPLVLARPQDRPRRLPDNSAAKRFLRDVGASRVTVLGGTAALGDRVVRDVAGSRSRERIAGADRFATARRLTDAAVQAGGSRRDVLVATGRNYPDALSAGPAALARGGVLVLTERDGVPSPTRRWLAGTDAWRSWRVVGGNVAVTHATVRDLRAAADL